MINSKQCSNNACKIVDIYKYFSQSSNSLCIIFRNARRLPVVFDITSYNFEKVKKMILRENITRPWTCLFTGHFRQPLPPTVGVCMHQVLDVFAFVRWRNFKWWSHIVRKFSEWNSRPIRNGHYFRNGDHVRKCPKRNHSKITPIPSGKDTFSRSQIT